MMEYKLYGSPRKALTLLLGCAAFVVPLLLLNLKKPMPGHLWVCVAFFGFGMLVGLHALLDKKPRIILDEEGIWDRSLRRDRIPWSVIQDAYPVRIAGQTFIALVLDEAFDATIKVASWARYINAGLGTRSLNLNLGQIRVNADKLSATIGILARLDPENRATLLMVMADGGVAM